MSNGLPKAWTRSPTNPTSAIFGIQPESAPIVPSQPAARPTVIRTPTLRVATPPAPTTGSITINATPDEFASLIQALNRATGQGQPQVRFTQDPIAVGLVGLGVVALVGIGAYSIAMMSAQSPAAVQKAELDRIERISARESAATRKIAEKAAEQRSICVFSLGCPGGK